MSGSSSDTPTLTRASDMLVEVGYSDDEITWHDSGGRPLAKCTYCMRNGHETEYPAHDVMVIRHWKANTPKDPNLGWWAWYCPEHYAKTAPWPSSLRAPQHLIPVDLDARIAANLDAATHAEAEEYGRAEKCIALVMLIPAGRWTTIADIAKVVYGSSRHSRSVRRLLASLSTSERCLSRIRNSDGTCSVDERVLTDVDALDLVTQWNNMAREDGLHVVTRTGVAFAAYRLSLDDLHELSRGTGT